jgi:hypothetical protein
MRFIGTLVAFGLALTLTSAAYAQDADAVLVDPDNPGVVYKKVTEYDFEDDVVEGKFVRPEGEFINSRRNRQQNSLIRIRENFLPEMLKSAEDI